MIVQHQNEESNSPTITNFTTIWADQNIDNSVVSELAAACAAASAGCMLANPAFKGSVSKKALGEHQARHPAFIVGRGLLRNWAETWAAARRRRIEFSHLS